MPSSPSTVPVLQHGETYAAACSAPGRPPALGPFAAWLADRVAAPTALDGSGPDGGGGGRANMAWRPGVAGPLHGRHAGGGPSPDEFLLLYGVIKRPGSSKSAAFGYVGLGPTMGGQMLARGWLTEGPDPADGRRTRVAPSPAGHVAFLVATAVFTTGAEALVVLLTGPDLQRLEQFPLEMRRRWAISFTPDLQRLEQFLSAVMGPHTRTAGA